MSRFDPPVSVTSCRSNFVSNAELLRMLRLVPEYSEKRPVGSWTNKLWNRPTG